MKKDEDISFVEGFNTFFSTVNQWFPRLKGIGKTFSQNDFNLKNVAYKEYNTSYVWL